MDLYQIFITHNRPWTTKEIIIFSIIFFIVAVVAGCLLKLKKIVLSQAIASLILLIFLGIVFGSTVFTRIKYGNHSYELEVFWSWKEVYHGSKEMLQENLLNILLLMPMGVLLPIVFRKKLSWWQGLLAGVLVSAAIETCQLIFCRGLFEWDDMIHNGLGCMISCMFISLFYRRRKKIKQTKAIDMTGKTDLQTDIIPAFRDSIFRDNADVLKEYGELAIDTVLGKSPLSSLPIVNTVSAVCETGLNIKERNYLRQTLAFIRGFNCGAIEQDKLDDYRKNLISDKSKADRELGRIAVILDSTIEQEQSEMLGRFYKAYVWGSYDWDMFRQLSAANQKLIFCDYETMDFIGDRNVCSDDITPLQRSSIERLQAVGLVQADGEIQMTCGTSVLNKHWYYLSMFGMFFRFYSVPENFDKKLVIPG